MQQQFAHCFSNVLLAPDARLRLLPHLFSIEQLPRQHCETFTLLEQQTAVLMQGKTMSSQHRKIRPPCRFWQMYAFDGSGGCAGRCLCSAGS
jgi:hypothetical protein